MLLSKTLALTGSLVVAALATPSTTSEAPEPFAASVLATTTSARVGGAAHGISQQRKPTLAGVVTRGWTPNAHAVARADLRVELRGLPTETRVEGNVTYRALVRNVGRVSAKDIAIDFETSPLIGCRLRAWRVVQSCVTELDLHKGVAPARSGC
jgi:hypothetical protein